jgi:voltage-gated potassium channel
MIQLRGRITLFLIAVLSVIAVGMIGFMYIKTQSGESPSLIDAFSWTVVTLTTLGAYTADTTLDTYLGKLFTSFVVIMGISVFFIGTPLIVAPWLEKKITTAVKPRPLPIPKKGHVIICGYGEIIEEVVDALKLHNVPYVVIDNNQGVLQLLQKKNIPHIFGDPTNDKILTRANISQAISLIAAKDDKINAFICLSAKALSHDLRVISISQKIESTKPLYAAGAATVINPRIFAGSILGKRACHDYTLEVSGKFASFGDLEIRQYALSSSSIVNDRTIKRSRIRSVTGAIIIGLWKEGQLIINPSPDEVLKEGTTIIAMGTTRQLDFLYSLVGGKI